MKFSDNGPAPRPSSASVSTKASGFEPPAFGGVAGSGRGLLEVSEYSLAKALGETFDDFVALVCPDGEAAIRLGRQLYHIGNIQPFTIGTQQLYGILDQIDDHMPDIPILSTLIGGARIGTGIYVGKLSTQDALFDGVKQALGLAGFAASHVNPLAEKAVKLLTVLVDGGKVGYLLFRRFHKAAPKPPSVPAGPASVPTLKSAAALNPLVLGALAGSWVSLPKPGPGQIIGSIPDFSIYKPQQWDPGKQLPGLSHFRPVSVMKTPASNVFLGTLAHPEKGDAPSPLFIRGQV
jgi:hypothetical protein